MEIDERPRFWRKRAADIVERLANTVVDPKTREALLKLSDDYLEMAKLGEARRLARE
jgi:hypothetical protein